MSGWVGLEWRGGLLLCSALLWGFDLIGCVGLMWPAGAKCPRGAGKAAF